MSETLYWKCPTCGAQSDFWATMEALECLNCGIAPNKAIERKETTSK